MAQNMDYYKNLANQAYNGTYAVQLQNLLNQKNQQLAQYDQNTADANASYDNQLKTNGDNGIIRENNYNNNVLARGMGRSSIATTGIAGIENQTADAANQINLDRQNKLNEIQRAKQLYSQNYDNSVNAINAEQQAAINKYAQDLYNADVAYQRQKASSSSKSSSASAKAETTSMANQAWANLYDAMDNGSASDWLTQNRADLVNALGNDVYQKMKKYVNDNLQQRSYKMAASQYAQNNAGYQVGRGGRMLME